MQDIIAFLVNLIRSIISLCNSNILLQWSLYVFVLFSILFAFKVVFSRGRSEFHDRSKREK